MRFDLSGELPLRKRNIGRVASFEQRDFSRIEGFSFATGHADFPTDHPEGMLDLVMTELDGSPGSWTAGEETPLTVVSGLDAASRPDWFIPGAGTAAPSVSPASAPASTAP